MFTFFIGKNKTNLAWNTSNYHGPNSGKNLLSWIFRKKLTSYGVSNGFSNAVPQSIDRRGHAICTQLTQEKMNSDLKDNLHLRQKISDKIFTSCLHACVYKWLRHLYMQPLSYFAKSFTATLMPQQDVWFCTNCIILQLHAHINLLHISKDTDFPGTCLSNWLYLTFYIFKQNINYGNEASLINKLAHTKCCSSCSSLVKRQNNKNSTYTSTSWKSFILSGNTSDSSTVTHSLPLAIICSFIVCIYQNIPHIYTHTHKGIPILTCLLHNLHIFT